MGKRKEPGQVPPSSENQPKKLTWREERFIEAFIENGGNALQAFLAAVPGASYSYAHKNAYALLAKPGISEAVELQRAKLREQSKFTRERALNILMGMAGLSLDDVTPLFTDVAKRSKYRGLGYKRFGIESAKKTVITMEDGSEKVINEVKIISPGERKAIINDLWEKLGLGQEAGAGNWFDGFERLANSIQRSKKKA